MTKDDAWARWNSLTSEERAAYIDHAVLLLERGYVQRTEDFDTFDLAMSVFVKKLESEAIENARRNQSP